jgi:UDP-N-acetylmuramoyl-tripeptide--D-alanyl-D-alanine ligase
MSVGGVHLPRRYRSPTVRFRASDVARPPVVGSSAPTSSSTAHRSTPGRLRPGELFVALVAERDGHEFIDGGRAVRRSGLLTSTTGPRRRHRDRGSTPARRVARPRPVGAQPTRRRARGRHHGQRRQDEHQGPARGGARRLPSGRRQPAASTTTRVCRSRSSARPTTPRCSWSRWACADSARSPELCDDRPPHVGVVTAVGHAHTELVGGIEGVARAKSRDRDVARPATVSRC